MPELAEIFSRYGPEYLAAFGDRILPSHRRALRDISGCRTEACGGHLEECDHCGRLDYVYHSCHNRSCPKCHYHHTAEWLEKRQEELLPVPYFHVVFTVPKELRELIRTHQKALYAVLMQSAAESLMKLAADPKYVGGKIGILSVLHTWTRAQIHHPHVHCLVPGGGVSSDGAWTEPRHSFLVPVQALSEIFRAKFMAQARKALPEATFPKTVWEKKWVVFCKPVIQGPEKILEYLGRYIHRIAITNNRILSVADGRVTFRYKDSQAGRWRTMTLEAFEFIRRFLQHVLPAGFHKVRYYGLLSPANRRLLNQVRLSLTLGQPAKNTEPEPKAENSPSRAYAVCPCCKVGIMRFLLRMPPIHTPGRGRPPP